MSARSELLKLLDSIFGADHTYSNEVPGAGFPSPYAGIADTISEVPELRGDIGTLATRRIIQVDVWQHGDDENDDLIDSVVALCDGAKATAGLRFRWTDTQRLYEPDTDTVHHAINFSLARLTSRAAD